MTRPIRVLVVDDSVVYRMLVKRLIVDDPALEVAGVAANGRIALAKIAQLSPDLVTLDLDMPDIDGLETLRRMRREFPQVRAIMLSALTARGAVATLDALSLGASDYVTKPSMVGSAEAAIEQLRAALLPRIKSVCPEPLAVTEQRQEADRKAPPATVRPALLPARIDAVVIGVSTGGPRVLSEILPRLPASFPVPVLVVQHMPPMFTRHLADRLDRTCALKVREGEGGLEVEAGQIWIAPGALHMSVVRSSSCVELEIHEGPPENSCRPAVDVLFRSAATVYGANLLAIVLTGMGQDGARGSASIKAAGGAVLVQDEASSVVWSMPRNVIDAGLADEIIPLEGLPDALMRWAARGRASSIRA